MLSKCCKAKMTVESGGCVAYYVCESCGRATEALVVATNPAYTGQNETTQGIDDV